MNIIIENTCQSNTKQQINNPYYNYNKENKNADLVIRSYFKSALPNYLISKINYKNSENKVEIQFFFYNLDINNKKSKNIIIINKNLINKDNIKNLNIILENIYEKKVCIVINRIYYPYINAQILSEYLGIKSESDTFVNFKRSIIKNNVIQINNLSVFIVGIKIIVYGRIITERVIPRKTQKYKILGTFNNKTNNKQIKIDKGQINIKNDLGSFTITVELAIKINKIL